MIPLAEQMRPKSLSEFIGQEKLLSKGGVIRSMLESGNLTSMIFWGPPASGKTALARIIANQSHSDFFSLSAVIDGKSDLKNIIERAKINKLNSKSTIIFIDEIHRWNKAQQDALLPFLEDGTLILIGATTENPSFSVISALLSRARVYIFEPHNLENLMLALNRALDFLQYNHRFPDKINEILLNIASISDGDMRFALTTLEISLQIGNGALSMESVQKSVQRSLLYDRKGEEHYNLISALHKSLRSSNPTAATYWSVRMLEAGEDPLYLVRRMIRFASEDIGNANPNALLLANQVYLSVQNLGMPECAVHIVQLCQYLAECPKSNSSYTALNMAKEDIKKYGALPVPMHLRNAPTKLMKEWNYGKGYEYDHDLPGKKSDQQLMPDKLKERKYFG